MQNSNFRLIKNEKIYVLYLRIMSDAINELNYTDEIEFEDLGVLYISADELNICITFDDQQDGRYSAIFEKQDARFRVIPAIFLVKTIAEYLPAAEITITDGSCTVVLPYEYMGQTHPVVLELRAEVMSAADKLRSAQKRIAALEERCVALEKQCTSLENINAQHATHNTTYFELCNPKDIVFDWMEFHKFMLHDHQNQVLIYQTSNYKQQFQSTTMTDILQFMNKQMGNLTAIANNTYYGSRGSSSYTNAQWDRYIPIPKGCGFILNEQLSPYMAAFFTYMTVKKYRPWVVNDDLYFIEYHGPVLVFGMNGNGYNRDVRGSITGHLLNIGSGYLVCQEDSRENYVL
jgi:hypothetical protein